MATITVKNAGAVQVYSDEQMLADVQGAIRAVLTSGQATTIFGAFSNTRADLDRLQSMESMYRARVLAARGYSGRNVADFSGGSGNDLPY
jgi:hypothetical protein